MRLSKKNILELTIISIIYTFLTIYNFKFSSNFYLGGAISVIQFVFLIFFLIKGYFYKAFFFHLLFLFSSFEFSINLMSDNITKIYNYRTFSMGDISISVIFLIFFCFILFINKKTYIKIGTSNVNSMFNLFILYLLIIGIITGFIGILVDDFNFAWFINDMKQYIVALLYIYIFSNLNFNIYRYKKITILIFGSFIGTILSSYIAGMIGIHGFYGGIKITPSTSFEFFIPLLFLCLIIYKNKFSLLIFIIGIAGSLLYLKSGISGKGILVYLSLPIFILFISFNKKQISKFIVVLMILILLFIPILSFLYNYNFNNKLLNAKINQVKSIFNFSWINNPYTLPLSPRIRVLEFLNIYNYYKNKQPLKLLFGNGFGGYFTHEKFPMTLRISGFSKKQIELEKFYKPHESFNVIFLKFGLIGLIFWMIILFRLLKNTKNSFFATIGFVWLMFFLDYTFIFLAIGMVSIKLSSIESQIN